MMTLAGILENIGQAQISVWPSILHYWMEWVLSSKLGRCQNEISPVCFNRIRVFAALAGSK